MYLAVSPAASLDLSGDSVKVSGNTKAKSSSPLRSSSALVYRRMMARTQNATSLARETAQSCPIALAYSLRTVALGSLSPLTKARTISPEACSSLSRTSGPPPARRACTMRREANRAQPVRVGRPRPCRTSPAMAEPTSGTVLASLAAASRHVSRASDRGLWLTACTLSFSSCSSVRSTLAAWNCMYENACGSRVDIAWRRAETSIGRWGATSRRAAFTTRSRAPHDTPWTSFTLCVSPSSPASSGRSSESARDAFEARV
mmetsp:Transcript_35020/g.67725  ORF Transcript_35020/g.67725 Transcript_35020/m.67725 type:complete len:260 (-) Transcript_35020:1096-1875(-)